MAAEILTSLAAKIEPGHTALLVVDVQNDFCHAEGYVGKQGLDLAPSQAMVPNLERLIAAARAAAVPVCFIQAIYDDKYLGGPFLEHFSKARVPMARCAEGSWGADFYQVKPAPGELVIVKHCYSPFVATRIDPLLRTRGIKTLIVTGVTTNVCVESTARDGFVRDYYIVLPADCAASYDVRSHEAAVANIGRHFGVVATSQEIVALWQPAQERVEFRDHP